jgi:uncharacterized protein (TIGR02001 family)
MTLARIARAFALTALPGVAPAQSSAPVPATAPAMADAPAATPDWTMTGNLGVFSQYVFRGLSQTDDKPALQGGFDVAHRSGFYAGTWLSNISWYSDTPGLAAASARLEWDLYGGWKWDAGHDVTLDAGLLQYAYPGRYPAGATRPDTLEGYVAASWKFLQVKYSTALTDRTFGIPDSRGSDYIEANVSYDVADKVSDVVGKVTLIGHAGHQRFRHAGDLDYGDWKLGASADVSGFTVGAFVTGTNADAAPYTNRFGRDISRTHAVAFIQKTF